MLNLNTTSYTMSYSGATTYQSSSTSFVIPVPMMNGPKPLSYDFRVAEYTNADGTIAKVKLQVQVWEHDQSGYGTVRIAWHDVERVKIPLEVPV
jgi:hypothetical protein